VKILSPFGEYPFVFDRVERRGTSLAVIGSVAGVESRVILEPEDLRALVKVAAVPLAALVVAIALSRR
jgi:hypothetical protein